MNKAKKLKPVTLPRKGDRVLVAGVDFEEAAGTVADIGLGGCTIKMDDHSIVCNALYLGKRPTPEEAESLWRYCWPVERIK
jgi:hypothetical protein